MTEQKLGFSPTRRRFLSGAGALTASGWIAGAAGSWTLYPGRAHAADPIKMGIVTDITGALAPSGNANWQVAQFTVEQINKDGGVLGRPIQLFLEDTASDPNIAVGNVRRMIQEHRPDVVLGGITSAMRQAIKDPIVTRGRTLYIYPQLYEGQECTKDLFCTGPTPAQQCDKLIPYLIKVLGKKRFAMPSANYVWPQVINKYARKIIEDNGGQVIFEEYYPLDQPEYSATISKIKDGEVDCVFNTVIPPGLQPFMKQLYLSGFQKNGGILTCLYFDENTLNYLPAAEMEGLYSCLDYFQAVNDPFSEKLQQEYSKRFPGTKYLFTAGTAATGMYRGIKFYEVAVKETKGDLHRDVVAAAMDHAVIENGPGGGAAMVPGHRHCKMNMYIATCQLEAGQPYYKIVNKADMLDPREC
jgi:ABC-type branched-subunit amino acid transport system substrate-binding protein